MLAAVKSYGRLQERAQALRTSLCCGADAFDTSSSPEGPIVAANML
jgi:hypothetical protein